MSEFLPPVMLKLGADISDYLAKLAEADAALKVLGDKAGKSLGSKAGDTAGKETASAFKRALSGLGGALSGTWKTFLFGGLIPAGVGGAAQLVSALAPAVGAVGLLPAAALTAATALGTLKIALSGVGAAISAGMSGNVQKFNDALKGLAPAAQQAARAVVGLKPQLDALKKTVQQNFFVGLAGDIKALGGQYLPILRTELGNVATGFNEVFGSVAQMARAPATVQAFSGAMHNVMLAITRAADALPGFLAGLARIGAVGSSLLPGLAAGWAAVGDRFNAFIARVQASGQLQAWIQSGVDTLRLLGPLLRDVGSILNSLITAMGSAGGQALGVFGQLIGVIAQFFKSAQGMQVLTTLFSLLGQVANTLGGALGQVLVALGPLLGALLSALQPIIGLLTGQFLPVVVHLVETLASALIPVINALGPALTQVASALMPLISLLGTSLGQILAALAPVIAQLAISLGQVLAQTITALMPAFQALLPVIVELAQAVLPALIPVIRILADLLIVQAPLIGILARLLAAVLVPVIKLLVPLVNLLVPPLNWLADVFDRLVGMLAESTDRWWKLLTAASTWRAVGSWFAGLWRDIIGWFAKIPGWLASVGHWFQELPGKIMRALERLPGFIIRTMTEGMHRFAYLVGYGIGEVVRFFEQLPGRVMAFLTGLKDGAVALVELWWRTTVTNVSAGIDAVVSFLSALPGKVEHWFIDMYRRAYDWASGLIRDVVGFFTALPGKVWAALQDLPGKIQSAVSDAGQWLWHAGQSVVQGLLNGIKSMWQSAVNFVKGLGHDIVSGFNDAIQSKSPSRVFAESGKSVVDGFVLGVNANASRAVAAVSGMLAFGQPATLGSSMFGGGGAGLGPTIALPAAGPQTLTVVMHNHNTTTLDSRVVHRQLIQTSQRYKLRTGTTGLT